MIDFEPTEEQQLIIETVRQFAANEVRPRARPCDETASLPRELLAKAHELGLVANALPAKYGGGGERSAVTGVLVAEELAWGDLSLAVAILSPALAAYPLADFGTEEQKQGLARYAGEAFRPGALAVTEPRFGADPFRPATRARRDGEHYVLDGAKCQVPWMDGDESVLVTASEGERAQLFLVERGAPGLKVERERHLGIQALPTAELWLEGVRVPAAARLGGEAGADVRALVARGRTALAALGVGVARAAFELSRDYAKERHTFGAPIATRQAIAFKLADMAIEIDGARLLTWEAAWRLDRGDDALREATLAYDQVRRVALEVADGAVQVFGGHGYTREYLPEMHLRNARGFASFEALALV
ncbi:MAG TPA: acyl-CoA dehydrogenase family protein [Myxococcota bacterium]|jgi:alkylation response protein AidB-like acyl-CoA dehydrogenase|nr:acyl-CoA dehydrogenase family protein [Myxococcota bacterium]